MLRILLAIVSVWARLWAFETVSMLALRSQTFDYLRDFTDTLWSAAPGTGSFGRKTKKKVMKKIIVSSFCGNACDCLWTTFVQGSVVGLGPIFVAFSPPMRAAGPQSTKAWVPVHGCLIESTTTNTNSNNTRKKSQYVTLESILQASFCGLTFFGGAFSLNQLSHTRYINIKT